MCVVVLSGSNCEAKRSVIQRSSSFCLGLQQYCESVLSRPLCSSTPPLRLPPLHTLHLRLRGALCLRSPAASASSVHPWDSYRQWPPLQRCQTIQTLPTQGPSLPLPSPVALLSYRKEEDGEERKRDRAEQTKGGTVRGEISWFLACFLPIALNERERECVCV